MARATNVPVEMVDSVGTLKKKPGSFRYYQDAGGDGTETGIVFSCPCGCAKIGSLPLVQQPGRPVWTNSGTRERPTLAPSVGIFPWDGDTDVEPDGFHWHGWLKAGAWVCVYA